ncbi:MAG: hypothetical protein LBH75_05985 [Treponema sp.]|jgi:hypothetical protein|nr:hypothetical protein [Treponema sp.]
MRISLILLISLLAMNGCKSAPPPPPATEVKNVPDWISLPPPEDELWGIGSAFAVKDYDAMLTAETRAKAAIVQQLELYLGDVFTLYNNQANVENKATAALIEDAVFRLDNMLLKESIVNMRQQMPDKTWWYRVGYKKTDARSTVFQILDSEIEQYPEFNPNRAIVFFDEQMAKNSVPIVISE